MKKLVFYIVFLLMFVIGGTLNYFGILSYKMIFGAVLPLVILPFVKIRQTSFFMLLIVFFFIVIASAIINKTNWILTFWFMQNLVIPFLMYQLVTSYLNPDNIAKVYKWVVIVASIQLPVILLQRLLYPIISRFSAVTVSDYDIGFGTFYTSDDIALSFFVLGVALFLLIDEKNNHIIPYKVPLLIWLSLTVLVLNSKISYLLLGFIWIYYLVTRVKFRTIMYLIFAGIVVFGVAYISGLREQVHANILGIQAQLAFDLNPSKAESFYKNAQGNRTAALIHLASEPLKIIGEGPQALYNPIENKFNKGGDTGQFISFYVDVGILGLLVSCLIIYSIVRGLQYSEFTVLYMILLFAITAVSNIFLDASMMMIFIIFVCSYRVPDKPALEDPS